MSTGLDAKPGAFSTLRASRSANRLVPTTNDTTRHRSASGGEAKRPGLTTGAQQKAKPATHTRDGSSGGLFRANSRAAASTSKYASGPPQRATLTPLPSITSTKPSDDLEELIINDDAADSFIFIGIDFGTT
jgi:hypothetical protein